MPRSNNAKVDDSKTSSNVIQEVNGVKPTTSQPNDDSSGVNQAGYKTPLDQDLISSQ